MIGAPRRTVVETRPDAVGPAFNGLIDPFIVEGTTGLDFIGAVSREAADSGWTWMQRQLAPDLLAHLPEAAAGGAEMLEALLPQVLDRALKALDGRKSEPDARGVRALIGGGGAPSGDPVAALPALVNVLRYRGYLPQARQFGQAANAISEAALVQALSVMPVADPGPFSVLIYVAIAELQQPARLVQAVIRMAQAPTEAAIARSGHVPVIDALLTRAFSEFLNLKAASAAADVAGISRAIDRYHRLARAITAFIELPRRGRWTELAATMTKDMSSQIEPMLQRVAPDVNRALRKPRDGEHLDDLLVQSAVDGCRLLATVRDCRDSLAVNAASEQTWTGIGELLETQIERMMEQLRATPGDVVLGERIDAAIAMAAHRFGQDYADVLRRSRETVSRRAF